MELDIPKSKMEGLQSTIGTEEQKREDLVDVYINSHPCPSWKGVARALNNCGHCSEADEVTSMYIEGE